MTDTISTIIARSALAVLVVWFFVLAGAGSRRAAARSDDGARSWHVPRGKH